MNFRRSLEHRLKKAIRDVPDYPKPGIVFKDITPVLADPNLVKAIVKELAGQYTGTRIDAIVAVEARGFIFGGMLAHAMNCRFVPVRKTGKLPYRTLSKEYTLEYGLASVEVHEDALEKDWNVVIHDDLLATGGTAAAAGYLVQQLGGKIAGFSFLINLGFLPGERHLLDNFGIKPTYLVSF